MAVFQAEARAQVARWLFVERVGRNRSGFYWVWRELWVFEVFEKKRGEGVCSGMPEAWVASGGDLGCSVKVVVG